MRVPLIDPKDLSAAQRPIYADMKAGIEKSFNSFVAIAENGALMGPWNPWLHEPRIGQAIWDLTKAMSMEATLPDNVRQIAILCTGAHFNAGYEIYAHAAVAEKEGMSEDRLSTLCAGVMPAGLTRQEQIAYDLTRALLKGGILQRPTYDMAVQTFGQHGANELIYLVGLYCLVSVTLNGFNVPVPEKD
jgi:alkylhydroperoxidase family enzyme